MKTNRVNVELYLIAFLLIIIIFQQSDDNGIKHYNKKQQENKLQYLNYNTQRIEPFTRIGLLYKDNSSTILPLYGRRTHIRSNTWNYYTETNDDNRIQIEINIKNRQCIRNTGCKELYNGDIVNIPEYNSIFIVKLYL